MDDDQQMGRSAFLRKGLAYLLGKAAEGVESVERRVLRPRFRPPGALPESEFLATCERCTACVQACDPGVINIYQPEQGLPVGTPYLNPEQGPCQLCPELPCISACPSGALQPTPLDQVRIGKAVLDQEQCIAYKGESCQVCLDVCPLPEKAIEMKEGQPVILDNLCTGCGVCSFACVTTPRSIRIVSL